MFRCKLKRCQSDTPLQVQIIFSRVRTLGLGMRGTRARDCGLMSRCRCYVSTMRQVFIYLSMHCLTLATHSTVHHSTEFLENIVPQWCRSRPVQPGPICWRWRSKRWSRMRLRSIPWRRRSWPRRRRCIPTWLRLDWGGAGQTTTRWV